MHGDCIGYRRILGRGAPFQDRESCFQVRGLDVGDQTPCEARVEPFLDRRDVLGRAVARNHNLFLRVMQFVESVEELFLCAVFRAERLNIVDQQNIG